jgi:tetratricopeptide (TPR) repeat protein
MKNYKFVISLLLILGGFGSIIFGYFPIISSVLIILGVLGSLISFLASESRNQEMDYFNEIQAILLAEKGVGNIYSRMLKKDLLEKGKIKDPSKLLTKALNIDPDDEDALSFYSIFLALFLSKWQWLGVKMNSNLFKKHFNLAKEIAQRGIKLYPQNNFLLLSSGILFDIEGNHQKARKYFFKSGKLRTDPYWRLLVATSWHRSGEHLKALNEIKKSEKGGAEGWIVNFYHGRALNAVGNYMEALPYLELALSKSRYSLELWNEISISYHLKACFIKSAKYVFKLSFNTFFLYPLTGLKLLLKAITVVIVSLSCLVSKMFWKLNKSIPFIRELQTRLLPPDEPEFTLGNILMKKGNYEGAEKYFKYSCNVLPNKADSHSNLGLCLALLGLKDEALKEYEKSIELSPQNILLKHTKKQIESGNIRRIIDQNGNVIKNIK